jgi:hypothetical protein
MIKSAWSVIAAAAALTVLGAVAAPAGAQSAHETKEKPPLYTYEAYWVFPRARWGD